MQRYAVFVAAKRGLATALHSGDPAYDTLPAYFRAATSTGPWDLLESAAAAGDPRRCRAEELLPEHGLPAFACGPRPTGPDRTRRMVALLVDGLRYGKSRSEDS